MWRSTDENWSLFLDIEGFSPTYARDRAIALIRLGRLMEAIHAVGCTALAEEPHRLFAHQVGDGFVVVPSFGEKSLAKPLALAVIALRHVLAGGGVARGALSTGGTADVQGYYPKRVMDERLEDSTTIRMGEGLLNIFPVMGTALINSYKLSTRAPRGAILVLEGALAPFLPTWIKSIPIEGCSHTLALDWVNVPDLDVMGVANTVQVVHLTPRQSRELLAGYVDRCTANDEWKGNTRKYSGLESYDAAR